MPYRLLLVDDDAPMLDWLCSLDWSQADCEVVGSCVNGARALEAARDARAQIVLTDIVMPVMDGIALARALLAIDARTRIVFLSSYQEFEYARKALKLGVRDYLIKGLFDREELFACIRGAIERSAQPEGAQEERAANVRFPARIAAIALDRKWEGELPVAVDARVEIDEEDECEWLVAWPEARGEAPLRALFNAMRRARPDRIAYVGNGGTAANAEGVAACARTAREAAFYARKPYEAEPSREEAPPLTPRQAEDLRRMLSTLFGQKWEQYASRRLTEWLREKRAQMQSVRVTLGGWAYNECMYRNIENAEVMVSRILRAKTLAFLADELDIFKQSLSIRAHMPDEIASVLAYVRQNFARDLTLREAAEAVGYTPNYLGAQFSRAMGMSFREYLTQVRMTQAAAYLRGTSLKVYEVSAMVGYPSYRYFARIFKQYYGHFPKSLRDG